jgi:hypothetical protein
LFDALPVAAAGAARAAKRDRCRRSASRMRPQGRRACDRPPASRRKGRPGSGRAGRPQDVVPTK